jgi:hypothetical protein
MDEFITNTSSKLHSALTLLHDIDAHYQRALFCEEACFSDI